jgi:hypothetical protein
MPSTLAAALTACLCGAGRAGEGGTPDGGLLPVLPPPAKEKTLLEKASKAVELLWKEPGKVAARLKGRVLGSRIHGGMTPKQVEQILGGDSLCRTGPAIKLDEGKISRVYYYPDLGLCFTTTEQAGVLLVDPRPVYYDPLLD